MDFWELTKLLFRRWYFAVPMLLISVAGALLAGANVKPDYDAKLHIQLIPPLATPQLGQPHNPWVDLGIGSVGNAAIIAVGDKAVLDDLVQRGFTDNVTVSMGTQAPIITVEAIGSTPDQAKSSAHAMAEIVIQNINSMQASYGAPQGQLITTRYLDTGDNVSTSTSKVKRAVAVIGGVGLLVTSAATIGLDALLRNRSRRKAARRRQQESGDGEPPTRTDLSAAVSASGPSLSEDKPVTGRIHTSGGMPTDNTTTYRSDAWAPNGDQGPAKVATEAPLGLPDDATIVLPLPHKEDEWAAQARGSKRR